MNALKELGASEAIDPRPSTDVTVLTNSKAPPEWATNLIKRRPVNVAVVAMANKTARTLWALLAHARTYQSGYESQPV